MRAAQFPCCSLLVDSCSVRVVRVFIVIVVADNVTAVLRQVGLVSVLLGMVHIVACLWLHIGRAGLVAVDANGNPAPEGWMVGV